MTPEQAVEYALEGDEASPTYAARGLAVVGADRGRQGYLRPHETRHTPGQDAEECAFLCLTPSHDVLLRRVVVS